MADLPFDSPAQRSMLRFITCGSVDDGKSTLIGRLLYDTKLLFDDQVAALERDSSEYGTQGAELDFALLVDGLLAEREQGITIDVAHRYFDTARRKFIVADCPGHEQYTRNMVTGASTADCAVILVDVRKGVLRQTRRHAYLCHLLGIRHFVLAVNKMDLVDYAEGAFRDCVSDFGDFARRIGIEGFRAIPLSAFRGDNVAGTPSLAMPWYDGSSLLDHLEAIDTGTDGRAQRAFRFPVQSTLRPNSDFRGVAGQIAAGDVSPGDRVRILPSGEAATVRSVVTFEGELDSAVAGQSITLTLAEDVDCARGDVIAAAADPPQVADQFETMLVWLDREALHVGRGYWLKLGTRTVSARVLEPKYEVDIDTLERLAAKSLRLNQIGVAEVMTDRPLVFEPYAQSRTLGGFVLIDKETAATVAAGMIHFSLRRAQNVHWQPTAITASQRAAALRQTPRVLWFTGLSGSGKSTVADALDQKLAAMGAHTFLLDGDNVRQGLNRDLGFTEADRIENIRRIGEVAKLMTEAGLIVLTAFISPFRAERQMVRELIGAENFVEIHCETPLEVAEARDPKGLYKKARAGEIVNFTGIDSPYEAPDKPDLRIDTVALSPEEAAETILQHILPLERS